MKEITSILVLIAVFGVFGSSGCISEIGNKTFMNEYMAFEFPADWEAEIEEPGNVVILNKDPNYTDSISSNQIIHIQRFMDKKTYIEEMKKIRITKY